MRSTRMMSALSLMDLLSSRTKKTLSVSILSVLFTIMSSLARSYSAMALSHLLQKKALNILHPQDSQQQVHPAPLLHQVHLAVTQMNVNLFLLTPMIVPVPQQHVHLAALLLHLVHVHQFLLTQQSQLTVPQSSPP